MVLNKIQKLNLIQIINKHILLYLKEGWTGQFRANIRGRKTILTFNM